MSIVGAALLILVGVITLDSYDHPELGSPAGKALGGLCITAGALFAVNLLLVFKAIREEAAGREIMWRAQSPITYRGFEGDLPGNHGLLFFLVP